MAFSRNWDESDPDGSIVNANDIDLEIRQFKIDIRERLEQVSSFGTDTDPMTLDQGAARILVDTGGNRPATPDFEGQLFYETDTGDLYVAQPDGGGGLEWNLVVSGTAGSVELVRHSTYDDAEAAGSKETATFQIREVLVLRVSGTTDGNGLLTIDLNEVSGSWDNGNIITAGVTASPSFTGSAPNVGVVMFDAIVTSSNEFDLVFYDHTGTLLTGTSVAAVVWLPFLT